MPGAYSWEMAKRGPGKGRGGHGGASAGGVAPDWIVPPSIEQGSRTTGASLTLDTGVQTPSADSFTYQWFSQDLDGTNNTNLGTSSSYTLVSGDVGKYVGCTVTPSNGGVAGAAVTTRRTQAVNGSTTTPSVEWAEEVVTDAYLGTTQIADAWGRHQNRITVHEDGIIRLAYARRVSSVQYSRVMKRTAAATWSEDVQKQNNDCTDLLYDIWTGLPMLVTWPNASRDPTIFYGTSYASSYVIPGTWESYDDLTRHYGSINMGPCGTIVQTENHIVPPYNNDENVAHRWQNIRLRNGTWSAGTQVEINLATLPVTDNGERASYPYDFPYYSGGYAQGLADRNAHVMLKNITIPSNTFNKRYLYTTALNNSSDMHAARIANDVNNYNNPLDAFIDPLYRVWTTRDVSGAMTLTIHNADNSVTQRLGDTSMNTPLAVTYGRTRFLQDSRGRFWCVWMGNGGATAMKIMQVTVSGTEPTGALTPSYGTTYNLGASFSSWASAQSGVTLACPRGGNYVDNRIYGYFNANNTASTEKVVAFCIRLPD